MHPERINAGLLFPFLISLGFKSGTPFLPESAKVCQSYFEIFLTAEFADYADEIAKSKSPQKSRTADYANDWDAVSPGKSRRCLARKPQVGRLTPIARAVQGNRPYQKKF